MYTLNNIDFRIASSNAISLFKKYQAFALNEVVNGKFKFNKDSKETLLLNYEIWFSFILKVEKLFIRNSNKNRLVGPELSQYIKMSISETEDKLDGIMSCHPDIFNTKVRSITSKTHSIYKNYMEKQLEGLSKETIYMAFSKIVVTLSDILEELLHELHELEALRACALHNCSPSDIDKCNKCELEVPFISFTNISCTVFDKIEICPLNYRLGIYKEEFGFTKYYLKNYSNEEITDEILNLIQHKDTEILKTLNDM